MDNEIHKGGITVQHIDLRMTEAQFAAFIARVFGEPAIAHRSVELLDAVLKEAE